MTYVLFFFWFAVERKLKEPGSPQSGTVRQALKEQRAIKHVDKKTALTTGKKYLGISKCINARYLMNLIV